MLSNNRVGGQGRNREPGSCCHLPGAGVWVRVAEVAAPVIDRLRIIIIRHQESLWGLEPPQPLSPGSSSHPGDKSEASILTMDQSEACVSLPSSEAATSWNWTQWPQQTATKAISLSRFCSRSHKPQNKDIRHFANSRKISKYLPCFDIPDIFRDYHLRVFSILTLTMRLTFWLSNRPLLYSNLKHLALKSSLIFCRSNYDFFLFANILLHPLLSGWCLCQWVAAAWWRPFIVYCV